MHLKNPKQGVSFVLSNYVFVFCCNVVTSNVVIIVGKVVPLDTVSVASLDTNVGKTILQNTCKILLFHVFCIDFPDVGVVFDVEISFGV